MEPEHQQYDFYMIVHDVKYKGIQCIKTTVINERFNNLRQARAALDSARQAVPSAYIVGYSYAD